MNKDFKSLKPQPLWNYFTDICAIPHPSSHEVAIRQYMVDFAKKNGIECFVDEGDNVVMRLPATPGMEDRKGLILQAHLDMVPQKNSDKAFDFEKDAIEAYIDGNWVRANGTTLGADNGMGVAAILAAVTDKDLRHGPLEVLLTATEETGMEGAFGLKPGYLNGDILMNLDSETEGELYVGCAGGMDANIEFTYQEEPAPKDYAAQRVEIRGLKGGHSGIEIVLERGNANKLMNRLLYGVSAKFGVRLSSIDGGSLRNAIPREAFATVVMPKDKVAEFKKELAAFEETVKTEYKNVEDSISIKAVDVPMPATVIDARTERNLLRGVYACPNGVIRMSKSMPGLVQTSTNLARVVSEGGRIKIQCLMRSSSNSEKNDLGEMIRSAFELAGAKVELTASYDGWNPNMESPILKTMLAGYKRLFGTEPEVKGIHAGLECGIISGAYPNLDMISFGPTIQYPHSPDEKVNIASVQRFWDFLCDTIVNAPKK